MNIEGDGGPAIWSGSSSIYSFAQRYIDVEYEVIDEHHGYFQLPLMRRALLDIKPCGERPVRGMLGCDTTTARST